MISAEVVWIEWSHRCARTFESLRQEQIFSIYEAGVTAASNAKGFFFCLGGGICFSVTCIIFGMCSRRWVISLIFGWYVLGDLIVVNDLLNLVSNLRVFCRVYTAALIFNFWLTPFLVISFDFL